MINEQTVKLKVASTSVEYARWGELTGNIENQTDLINLLDEKADTADIPTKTSQLTNDSNFVVDANYVHTDNNFTTTLKNKLEGIEAGAETNVQSDWNVTDTTSDAYIKNKPTIPTVNNGTLTINVNGTGVSEFTANQSGNSTADISVPTKTSDLTNDSGFISSVPHATNSVYGTVKVEVNSDPFAGYVKLSHGNSLETYVPWLGSASSTIRPKFLPDATTSTKGAVIVDSAMSDSSTNPVQNSAIKSYIDSLVGDIETLLASI